MAGTALANLNIGLVIGSASYTLQQTIADDANKILSVTFAPSTSDSAITWALKTNTGHVNALVIAVTGGDLVIKTNSHSSPGDTLTIAAPAAGTTYLNIYVQGGSHGGTGIYALGTNPFASADVTSLHFDSTAGCSVTIASNVDSSNG